MTEGTTTSAQLPADARAAPVLRITLDLLEAFDREAVIYCYWKSGAHVGRALSGEKDLDILIARADQHRACRLLAAGGFKPFPCMPGRDHPAIASHVGFDAASGLLVHVHLHLRLVVGDAMLKNYRLPWESELLARAVPHPTLPVRVLDPASDALLLLVRACLEPSRLDPLSATRWSAMLGRFDDDLRAAATRVRREEVEVLARGLMDERTAGALAAAVFDAHPVRHRRSLRALLKRQIADHRLYNPVEARLRAAGRGLLAIAGRLNRTVIHAPRPWSRRAPGGGLVIAIVGLDGSGKSTLVRVLRAWLSTEVDVMPIYFGTGEGRPSLVLAPFKLLLPLVEPLFKAKPNGSSHGTVTKKAPGALFTTFLTVWATMVALEKRLKLVAARRAANRGMVVVADRYPQNEILRFNDGPLLPRLARVPGVLRRFEAATYRRANAMPPDLVLKLVITRETAARREPTMDREVIAERIGLLRAIAFPGARVVAIDAEQPLADVIAAAKREVWTAL